MKRLINRSGRLVTSLWQSNAPLTGAALLMLAVLAAAMVGLAVDPRLITGAPAWLKPAKFEASVAIYALTLAWIFTFLPEWVKLRRVMGWTTAVTLVLEVAIIALQAGRGATSHFNIGTPLDAALWVTMGLAIALQTLVSIGIAAALWRQSFKDPALGWALRLGLSLTILGASLGGLMAQPTEAQLTDARSTGRMSVAGSHTVGAADGGPGLPGTGWNLENGDLRVPHFFGLHAMQALPLIAIFLRRRGRPERTRVRLTLISAASYALLFGILLWQALRGQGLVHPDSTTIALLAGWLILTATASLAAWGRQPARAPVVC